MLNWNSIWRTRAEDWIFSPLEPKKVPENAMNGNIEAESGYINVWLKSARVLNVRKGLKKFYGAVHSHIGITHRSQQKAEFNVVTTPKALQNVNASGIDRVIQLNTPLLGPVPYVGAGLDMEVGLFSVASTDLAAPYLKLLENLSKTAGVCYVSSALPFAESIMQGVNLLAGAADESILEIGFTTKQEPVKQGYFVTIRAPKGSINVSHLSIDPSDFRLLQENGAPFVSHSYLVIEIRSDKHRHDWSSIPDIANAYHEVQEEYRNGRRAGTEEALVAFRRIALTCNDLLYDDALTLAEKVRAKYEEVGPPRRVTRAARRKSIPPVLPDLNEIDISVDN